MFATLMAVFTLDRWGRRFSLFYGAIGQGIALIMVAVLTKPDIMAQNPTVSIVVRIKYYTRVMCLMVTTKLTLFLFVFLKGVWYRKCRVYFHLYRLLWYDLAHCSLALSRKSEREEREGGGEIKTKLVR